MYRKVIREFRGEAQIRATVSTQHPQFGTLLRGWIGAAPSPDWRSAWWVHDVDHYLVGDTAFVGDYLDAEAALLDATAGLDEMEETWEA